MTDFTKMHDLYFPQTFYLPNSVIYYLSKNPSSVEVYKKVIKTCKYFYANFPIIVLPCLHAPKDFSYFTCLNTEKCVNDVIYVKTKCHKLKGINPKRRYWVSTALFINAHLLSHLNIASLLIPKLASFDIKKLCLLNQNILFDELLLFSPYVKDLDLCYNNILFNDGTVAQIENVLAAFTKIITFSYHFKINSKEISSNSVINIVKLCHIQNLHSFWLGYIPQIFDFESFAEFMMKNQHIQFSLYFCNPITQIYIQKLQTYIGSLKRDMFQGNLHPIIEYPVFQ